MNCAVIVVGAGQGTRYGGEIPKQYQRLAGIPVFRHTLKAFLDHPEVSSVLAVIAPDDAALFAQASDELNVRTVFGGATRTASVRAGLAALQADPPDIVLIHDAARPMISKALISRLIANTTAEHGAAPSLNLSDALKRIDAHGMPVEDVSRAGLVQVQTPQAFPYAPLMNAYANARETSAFADDLALAKAAGLNCILVAGDMDNFKITHAGDLERAERVLGVQKPMLTITGTGYDVHKLIPGKAMMLCGVSIPGDLALLGHSDADAALHALTDAILGTIGAGDIGDHFPPSDPQWRGTDSKVFLAKAMVLLARQSARLLHVDLTIICERPKIKPHRQAMRARLSELLDLPLARISTKATTTEGLGFTGRGEGLAAMATVSVQVSAP
ncbi:MAG: bifunctional 2-C-methyl-D-erythritol 4-phosphate cytidylyltransferase/2-C-methyl-D-erythritol 2,4-cyclodiphosphate synthase [Robiginitomaculum sp.]|nr:MAG: bifunctional 2-C-methyl-D-erythritol 4-phosphate cytidylyltransferase/2-C-methyl-D-erythritol 2,4-cyclodiphosphate synthase [Robiginitomaculum sp.]